MLLIVQFALQQNWPLKKNQNTKLWEEKLSSKETSEIAI